ncbi:unnamed protein product, partial [Mesorhabditis belari]|uniref:Uncharacterized protein n=1 Tax=Mesorhabditis belari TaxID=2138241 RepID=A0AAF3F4S7_9BILA
MNQEAAAVEGWIDTQDYTQNASFRSFVDEHTRFKSHNLVFKARVPQSILRSLGGWSATVQQMSLKSGTKQWIPAPVTMLQQHRTYHGLCLLEGNSFTCAYDKNHIFAAGGFNGSTRVRSAEVSKIQENQMNTRRMGVGTVSMSMLEF